MKYTIYFELFGKKLKHAAVNAKSKTEAEQALKMFILSRLIIHEVKETENDVFQFLQDVVNGKK